MDEENSKILSEEERDSFEGTTIEQNGESRSYEDRQRDMFRDRAEERTRIHIKSYNLHSPGCLAYSLGLIFVVCLLAGAFVMFLPVYLVGALVILILGGIFHFFG